MEAPKNLLDAVDRLKPQAVLLLDTNTIMDAPRLKSYEIAAPGPFLLVVPRVVYGELQGLKLGNRDRRRREKASRALNVIDDLYEEGNSTLGIEISGDRRLISVPSPKEDESVENKQVQRNLGTVDAALLRLSIACAQDCPDIPTLLVTCDKNLIGSARAHGLTVCRLPDLRSSDYLGEKLGDAGLDAAPELDIASLLERTARVAMTLEEISGKGEYLIARGSGLLREDTWRYPFRWTFPYRNLSRYDLCKPDSGDPNDDVIMPRENLDFMGSDERILEPVKSYICGMLEYSGGSADGTWSLQSPLTQIRFNLAFEMNMDARLGGFFRPGHVVRTRGRSPEETERYDTLSKEHDRLMQSLIDGKAEDIGRAYRSAFELREELNELLGWDEEYDNDMIGPGPFDLDTSLIVLLADALSTWSVGETREEEFTYRPLALPEEEHEPAVVDEEDESDDTESC